MKPVRIGCSGWMYDDWRGRLYPQGQPERRWLELYAEQFDTVEVNSTFYRLARVIRHGKGDRRRVVPLSRPARNALRAWRTDREQHPSRPSRDEGPLWLSRAGQRLSVRSISKLVAGVMAAAGAQESAHGLRHTVATRLVRDHGRDLALVADMLKHADVKTTRRYARAELEDRRKALEKLDRGY